MTRRRLALAAASLVVAFVATLSWRFGAPSGRNVSSDAAKPTPSAHRFAPVARRPQSAPIPTPESSEKYEAGCLALWRDLETLDLNALGKPSPADPSVLLVEDPARFVTTVLATREKHRCGKLPSTHFLAEHDAGLRKHCADARAALKEPKGRKQLHAFHNCQLQLLYYRSALLNEFVDESKLDEISDVKRLIELFHASQWSGKFVPIDAEDFTEPTEAERAAMAKSRLRTEAIIGRILSVDPDNVDAARQLLSYRMFTHPIAPDDPNDRKDELREMRLAIDRLERIAPDDPTVRDSRVLLASQENAPDRIRDYARPLLEASAPKGQYYLAWASYLDGDRAAAIRQLEATRKRLTPDSPDWPRVDFALQMLREPREDHAPGPWMFQVDLPMPSGGIELPDEYYGPPTERPDP